MTIILFSPNRKIQVELSQSYKTGNRVSKVKDLVQSDRINSWQNLNFNQICCYSTTFYSDTFLHFQFFRHLEGQIYYFLSIQLIALTFFVFTYRHRMTNHGLIHLGLVSGYIAKYDVFCVKPVGEWKRPMMCKQHCITKGDPQNFVAQRDPKTECKGFIYFHLIMYITSECP